MANLTIKEIAEKANISIATVSRAINNPEKVAPATRDKINDILALHEYRPNQLAKGLVQGKSNTLSLVSPAGDAFFNASYFREIFLGITRAAANSKYNILIDQTGASRTSGRFPVDGHILISPTDDDPFVENLEKNGLPAVLINRRSDTLNWVDLDNIVSAELIVNHLLELGHKEIVIMTGKENVKNSRDRLKGYKNALSSSGIPFRPGNVLCGNFHEEKSYREMKNFLAKNNCFTAVFACNDLMAMGVMRAVQESGKKVPGDISVAGFDDIALASYISPSLTSVKQPLYMMGLLAVSSLIDLIEGNLYGQVNREFPGELILRESTAQARIRCPV